MDERTQQIIMDIGTVLVATIITLGFIALLLEGRQTDGLETGFWAVIGLFLGGGITKSASAAAAYRTKDVALGAAQANTQTAATVLNVTPVEQHTPQATAQPPSVPPVDNQAG